MIHWYKFDTGIKFEWNKNVPLFIIFKTTKWHCSKAKKYRLVTFLVLAKLINMNIILHVDKLHFALEIQF